jgi:predicted nucleic acid-binding OB-fold protein
MDEIKKKLLQLSNALKERQNKSFEFFDNLLKEIDATPCDVIGQILKSTAITQYADFNYKEESLFDEIWNLAKTMQNEGS